MGRTARPGQRAPGNSGDFLTRWSRRKTQARTGTAPPDEPAAPAPSPATDMAPPQDSRQERALTDADMPPLDTLTAESDFSPFLSPGVSDGLRQKALRILFSQPACSLRDGLDDYDGDYTRFEGLGSLVTHEMKRMLRHELEAARRRQQRAAAGVHGPDAADAAVPADPAPQEPAAGRPDADIDDAPGTA